MTRYAIHLCPDPASAAARAGAEWLGRCPARDAPTAQRPLPGVGMQLQRALTAAPARHGFHATIKPPFRLASGESRAGLMRALEELAATRQPLYLPRLEFRMLRGFLALVPSADDARLRAFAARCVTELDRFRAPPSLEEARRWTASELTERQRELAQSWGYPYVLEQYTPHFTLTAPLSAFDEALVARVTEHAFVQFAPVLEALRRVDAVALFEEPAAGAPFRLLGRVPLRQAPAGGGDPLESRALRAVAVAAARKTR